MKLLRYLTAGLPLAVLLMQGCANEDVVAESHNSVQFTISAPYAGNATRAANEGAYVAEALPAELMKKYAVAVTLRGSNKIVAFATKKDLTGVESDVVDLELRPGDYTVYGFANIDFGELADLGIKEGGTIRTDISTLRTRVPSTKLFRGTELVHSSKLGTTEFPAIPMTSIAGQDVTVTERVNQTFGIEVRRMLAKLQFDFRNPTAKDIQLESIAVSNMTRDEKTASGELPIRLMNYEEGRDVIDLPTDVKIKKLQYTLPTPHKLEKGFTGKVTDSPKTKAQHSEVFYVMESAADAEANAFQLDFELDEVPSPGLPDKMRYALTNPATLTLIHRNDWIVIPVTLGDWVMELQAMSYPPIGGYPDAKVVYDPDRANLFSVTFAAPGVVGFYPMIHKYYEPSDFFYLNDPDHIVPESTVVTMDDPSGIFDATPVLGSAGELSAMLTGASGMATITITTKIYPNYPDKGVEKDYKAIIKVTKL